MLRTTARGIAFIKDYEKCRLASYQDVGGIWTIGWGDTVGVLPGMVITQDEADARFEKRLAIFDSGVQSLVKVPLTDNEFDALVAFAYNAGLGSLESSHLLALLNAGDIAGAANEFPRWNHVKGKVVAGLTNRRAAERALFEQD